MLTQRAKQIQYGVGESLRKCASLVEPAGRGRWDFILSNGRALLASARAEGDWLHLDAPLEGTGANGDAWEFLRLNRALKGLTKLALPQGRETPHLRAEIPLDEEADFSARLLEACAGFKSAAGALHGETVAAEVAQEAAGETAAGLGRLCEQAGWSFNEKSAVRVGVDLEARGCVYHVAVERRAGGGVALSVELARGESFGEAGRAAAADMLLRASAAVKLARAAVVGEDAGASLGFEVVFGSAPCASEFGHALSALAVACGLCGREAAALADEALAARYLALRGFGAAARATRAGGRMTAV